MIFSYLLINNKIYNYNKEWKLIYHIEKDKNKYNIFKYNKIKKFITFIKIKKSFFFNNIYIYHKNNYIKIKKNYLWLKYNYDNQKNYFPKYRYFHLYQYPKLNWIKNINNHLLLKPKISGHHNLYRFDNGIFFYLTDKHQIYLYIGLAILEN